MGTDRSISGCTSKVLFKFLASGQEFYLLCPDLCLQYNENLSSLTFHQHSCHGTITLFFPLLCLKSICTCSNLWVPLRMKVLSVRALLCKMQVSPCFPCCEGLVSTGVGTMVSALSRCLLPPACRSALGNPLHCMCSLITFRE